MSCLLCVPCVVRSRKWHSISIPPVLNDPPQAIDVPSAHGSADNWGRVRWFWDKESEVSCPVVTRTGVWKHTGCNGGGVGGGGGGGGGGVRGGGGGVGGGSAGPSVLPIAVEKVRPPTHRYPTMVRPFPALRLTGKCQQARGLHVSVFIQPSAVPGLEAWEENKIVFMKTCYENIP
uniref:Uncharacterized protein n=1 Tax=Knipowitschia caucasica TaxID=637954 RepID=A0AAV2K5L8_KNICA